MANEQTIFRVASRHKPFAQLGNGMLRDTRLSFEARGVLAFILSFPSDWEFGLAWLCRDQGIGRDRARRIIREHVATGYCHRERGRNADGTLSAYEYVFTDEPGSIAPPAPEKASVVTTDVKPVTGEPAPANPTPTNTGQSHEDEHEKKEAVTRIQPLATDGGDRLPFTPSVLAEIGAMGVDPTAVVERYRERTGGRRIADPSAYLLRMARDEAAKRLGVPIAALVGLGSCSRAERARAQAASVGAVAKPSEAVLRGVERRARSRGDNPDEVIAAWRTSVQGLPARNPDRSLLAFADQRALTRRAIEPSQKG
jgi:hypothetical protein